MQHRKSVDDFAHIGGASGQIHFAGKLWVVDHKRLITRSTSAM